MKLKKSIQFDDSINQIFINWINYVINDINCYEELTNTEKSIISKELFNKITVK